MDIGSASELIIGKLAGCSHEGFVITGDLAAQVLEASKSGLEYRTRNGRSGIEKCNELGEVIEIPLSTNIEKSKMIADQLLNQQK